jgi:DNA-binding NarL/FixJ family response regulator
VRCLIVDDSPGFVAAARSLLERDGITVVGVASTIADALEHFRELQPDVTLVDIDLGGESGFELAEKLDSVRDHARSSVILVSTHAEQDFADMIASSPAAGFLPKSGLRTEAIRELVGRSAGLEEGDHR